METAFFPVNTSTSANLENGGSISRIPQTTPAVKCLRCGGELQEGFLIERQEAFLPSVPMLWQSGNVEKSYWAGIPDESARQRPVVARRCARCGGLELFAPESL